MSTATTRILYGQSGGPTPVLNATAAGLILQARKQQPNTSVYALKHGLQGLVHNTLYDTAKLSDSAVNRLMHTPASIFGSCRMKLPPYEEDRALYRTLFSTFHTHRIDTFIYQGGNDSQDTTYKIAHAAQKEGYTLRCFGLPKTIDNDLYGTDFCPGFPSSAKYLGLSLLEAHLDLLSMNTRNNSTQAFIMEVMGRNTGWLAAATSLACAPNTTAKHHILIPENRLDTQKWLDAVQQHIDTYGCISIVASEGLMDSTGARLSAKTTHTDAFNHPQLGGVGAKLADLLKKHLGLKTHTAVPDYLQRACAHVRSHADVQYAVKLGQWALMHALSCHKGEIMLGLKRTQSGNHTVWEEQQIPLSECREQEKTLPSHFYNSSTYHTTPAAKNYFVPLVEGEVYPTYRNGLPDYLHHVDLDGCLI